MSPPIRFGNAEIRPSERLLLIDGKAATLGSRAFDVLLALVERRERLVRKNELLDLVWPDTVVEENNLQSQVSQLRKLLGPQAISTIPGRGYRFTATVEESPSSETAAAPQAADAPRGEASAPPTTTALRTNLPAVLPALIGRDDDLLALGALIDRHRGTHRLVTIAGAGGIGKTRLAQTLLQARTGAFAHGVCFVDLAPADLPYERLPCGQVSIWSWVVSRSPIAAASGVRKWADRAVAHARAHGDTPALCVALAGLAELLVPGTPEAALVFDEVHALDDAGIAPMARSAGPIAEAAHLSKRGDAAAAIACLERGLAFVSETGVDEGIRITQSLLLGVKLAAGRTSEVLADGLPLLEQLQGTRNEAALGICRRTVLTALLAHGDLDRGRPLAQVGWRQAARFPLLNHAAWPDLLALLAALEGRPQAAAKLLGVGDAGWARTGRQRGPTTRVAVQRAESMAADALGDETFEHLRREGALLRSEDVDAIAFAAEDVS